ncbi:MAG: 3,4-dihydroxyphenylacetate 2,3-dioxygenase [Xanthobacteraceae bacterium]|nr:3,4-dihydroxyphenylacetate 2,3-dioxygenase [Xanthobacteraceae bacterium]
MCCRGAIRPRCGATCAARAIIGDRVAVPVANPQPPFNITRASHVVLTARDLEASRAFYADVLGFVATEVADDALYLRGLEERAHHSITIRRETGPGVCRRIGLRVFTDDDLARAAEYFQKGGFPVRWVEVPHQGKTLHVDDAIGTPLELCAEIDEVPSKLQEFHHYKGASPLRLDHFQVVAQDVLKGTLFYTALGFRLTEYTASDGGDELWGTWLQRKGNPHDVVLSNGRGPRLHHFAFTVPESRDIIHACDVAGSLRYPVERGPGRHGIGNALFVYFRDPDGHRIELFLGHYQAIDASHMPMRWDLSDTRRSQLWGLPARSSWFFEASEFPDQPPIAPSLHADPVTLETFLANQY